MAFASLLATEAYYADAVHLLKQSFGDQRKLEEVNMAALRKLLQI